MIYEIKVLRRKDNNSKPYFQSFTYETDNENNTVATALNKLNSNTVLIDTEGNEARKIMWQSSCLQKKCGACAMVICGRPRLACDAQLSEFKDGVITVEPLRKFPVVCDLVVDRSILYENLKTLKLWLSNDSNLDDSESELAYESSECIQCGICLEICPNFYSGGSFFGMSAVPVTNRLISEMSREDIKKLSKMYEKHIYEGCGKSLACKGVCPRNIDTEKLLVNSNAYVIWNKRRRRKK
mgnify:CR=1 FL=1